ncbi:lipopolysaccharide biosynthesis protein [Vibrio sp. E150_011]
MSVLPSKLTSIINSRGIVKLLFSNSAIAIIGLFTGVIIARNMDVSSRGYLAEIVLWVSLFTSIGSGTIKELIFSEESRSKSSYVSLAEIFAFSLLVFVVSSFIINLYFDFYWYFLLLFPISIISTVLISRATILGSFSKVSIYKVIVPFTHLMVLGIIMSITSLSVNNVLISLIFSNSVLLLIMLRIENIKSSNSNIRWRLIFVVSSSVLVTAINQQFDKILISTFYTSDIMAYYTIALTIVLTPLTIIQQSLSTMSISIMKQAEIKLNYFYKVNIICVLSIISVGFVIYITSPYVIPVVFGVHYSKSVEYVPCALLFSFLITYRAVFFTLLRSMSLNKMILKIQMSSAIFGVLLLLFIRLNDIHSDIAIYLFGFGMLFFFILVFIVSRISLMKLEER